MLLWKPLGKSFMTKLGNNFSLSWEAVEMNTL